MDVQGTETEEGMSMEEEDACPSQQEDVDWTLCLLESVPCDGKGDANSESRRLGYGNSVMSETV